MNEFDSKADEVVLLVADSDTIDAFFSDPDSNAEVECDCDCIEEC